MEPSQRPSSEWEQLFSIAPCGLVLLDSHAVIQFLNPSAGRLLGLDHEALGHPLTDVLPTWKNTPFYASLPSFLGAQSTFESIEFDVPGP